MTEEFHPGFRNSTAAYTVSLLNPKVIEDMRLYEHGLKVVLRKIDNFLPTLGPDHLLSGRGGLTRREIARHSAKDAEGYDAYSAALGSVVAILRDWILRAPPNAGGGLADVLAALKLGNAVRGMTAEEQRNLLDFFTKSAADILDRYFETPIVQALFGFDAVVGNYASPYDPGSAYVLLHHLFGEAAGVARRLGPCDRRNGRDHPGHGQGGAGERRRDHPRLAGRGDHRRARPRRRRRRRRQDLSSQSGGGERQSAFPLR